MSGGHFEYQQYRIEDIAREIEELIKQNNSKELDKYGYAVSRGYSDATISKFKEALTALRRAAIMAQRIDWLVSGDDGENSFHKRWEEELKQLMLGEGL